MLELFCIMVCTREYYHLVLKEPVLELLFNNYKYVGDNPFADPLYLEVIYHYLFYGVYLMYKEECTVRACVFPKYRHVMDLDSARWLPTYNGNIEYNPYLPISLPEAYFRGEHVPPENYIIKPLAASGLQRGLYSTEDFHERFKIFTNGIFDGLPMDRLWFGGSLIPACAIKNPLELMFGIKGHSIPIVRRSEDDPFYGTYMDQKAEIIAHWKTQRAALEQYFDEYFPSKKVLREEALQIPEIETKLSDIDIMVDVADDCDLDRFAAVIMRTLRKNLPEGADVQIIKIETKASYKYFVSGNALERTLEIFRTFGAHPLGSASRFHFPAVRGVYNGTKVFILPSMLCYANTGMFIDYKWMSSASDTKDLILKYYSRGGVAILNVEEHRRIAEHIKSESQRWGTFVKYALPGVSISLNHPIFRPRQYGHGIYYELKKFAKEYPYDYEWLDPLANSDKSDKKCKFGFDLSLRFPSGHLCPVALWKLGAYVHALKISERYQE
jgi:hypothetical protein